MGRSVGMEDVMLLTQFAPDLSSRPSFGPLLKEFSLSQDQFNQILKDWVVYYADLPEGVDGHTVEGEMRLNADMEPFNAQMTFAHESVHALQYATGNNVVKFKGDGPELKTLAELKEYVADEGERQAARYQLSFLVLDNGMGRDEAWEAMKYGWGMEPGVPGEVVKVARKFFEDLWESLGEKE